MITEKDLEEAIAECQGQRNPNANTCIKLAAYYTILDNIRGGNQQPQPMYSYSAGDEAIPTDVIQLDSDSEFALAISGRRQDEIWPVIDEAMTTLKITMPRLYAGIMRKIAWQER